MKLRILLSVLALACDATAQDAELPPVSEQNPSKPSPPKAQVIEEDEPVIDEGGDGSEVDPNGSSEVQSVIETPVDDAPVPAIEMAPVVEKPVNEGIQIQVEKFSSSPGETNDKSHVTVTSPWRAKPLDAAPLGWKFVPAPSGVDPYRTTVKLGGTQSVNLAITPYVLVPASDGRNVIRIAEPGYQPEQSHQQANTIGFILQQSTEEIEYNEKQAAAAIHRLQQLLSSLPQP